MPNTPIKRLLGRISTLGPDALEIFGKKNPALLVDSIGDLCSALLELRGEALSVTIAGEVLAAYRESSPAQKLAFFEYLNESLRADAEAVAKAIGRYQQSGEQLDLQELSRIAESPRQALFRALNMAPGGTSALIAMREDLLTLLPGQPGLKPIDNDFLHLFRSWFNRGFLELRRVDWQTPAVILEKIIEYESVHEITGWPDLRRRLAADRRCFSFFHPVIPDEPLIFVQVALTRDGISDNIGELLNQAPPDPSTVPEYRTAIFYSINNCLTGLRGVSFGNFLIKQVVDQLAREIPSIDTYATLSPIPGFLNWLHHDLGAIDTLSPTDRELLSAFLTVPAAVKREKLEKREELKPLLLRLCAHYLTRLKSRGKPADPVARFHLGNGAILERMNWLSDISKKGLEQSAGIMVNYLYDPKTLARNHEAYEQHDKVIYSSNIRKLLS